MKDSLFNREDYLFELPQRLIAQAPAAERDRSRLMVAGLTGEPHDQYFRDIGQYLAKGDVLALNRTKVMNARCFATKENGVKIEVFILSLQVSPDAVPVLLKPGKRARPGVRLIFPNAGVAATVAERVEGKAFLSFESFEDLRRVVAEDGEIPLPPYIKRDQGPEPTDLGRYQTVYARDLGAVAAPTAGLHFTEALLDSLRRQGVEVLFVTHHVGIGTFQPLTADDVRRHRMAPEHYEIQEETARRLNAAKREKKRIIAVGTTTTRCLESNYDGSFHAGQGVAEAYIYPGYRFRVIDGLITNFHLPGSTLILLVSALMGRDRILDLYREAIKREYRFYSYGDAMLLIP